MIHSIKILYEIVALLLYILVLTFSIHTYIIQKILYYIVFLEIYRMLISNLLTAIYLVSLSLVLEYITLSRIYVIIYLL